MATKKNAKTKPKASTKKTEPVKQGYVNLENTKQENTKHMQYGSVLFGLGLLIVIIGSFFDLTATATKATVWVLTLIGLIVGLLNITRTESVSFMVAGIAVVLLLGQFIMLIDQYIRLGEYFFRLLTYLNSLLVPAIVVVGLRTLFRTAKDK